MTYDALKGDGSIAKAQQALETNGMTVFVVRNSAEAHDKVLSLIPAGAEVMAMTSVTLEAIGVAKEINESGKWNAVRKSLMAMDRKTQGREMQKMGAAPEYTVGSVHAVTEDGRVMIASASGSQLPAYAYGSSKVIWVVGTQKIVENLEEGIKRVYEYVLPLEDARARKAYGVGSGVNKMLIVNKEAEPGRLTLIFVKEKLGF